MFLRKIIILFLCFSHFALCQEVNPDETLTPEEALAQLIDGNQNWVENKLKFIHQNESIRYKTAKEGQHPFATILTCSDSRVSPELIFDQGIGDLFVIRVAGNVVDIDEVASIEYGVDHLETPILVVLGHSKCGAVTAAYKSWKHKSEDDHSNIPKLLHKIQPSVEKVYKEHPDYGDENLIDASVSQNVKSVIKTILELSEDTKKRVMEGKLKIVGGVYNTYHGNIHWLFTPDTALELLKKGNEHWYKDRMTHPHHSLELRHMQATEGQLPTYTVITCSDSRVIPELIFDQGSGDIFVIRIAGNVIGDDELASIEYGVDHLHTPILLVLGHSNCGAVTAAVDYLQHPEKEHHGNIPKLVAKIIPAVKKSQEHLHESEDLLAKSIQANVEATMAEVYKNSPLVQKLVAEGKLQIVPAVYNIETGIVEWLNK